MSWITLFLSTGLGQAVSAGVAGLLGLLAFRFKFKRDGKKEARDDMQDQDRKNADAVRDRVRDVERVQPDDITYRD